ncbi:MAG TPA: hypothetical protein VM328_12330, partial [Fimbriimonadaceae bacterium]|nr:hypothetical protein [Fimbriimonadaceae bacterium]
MRHEIESRPLLIAAVALILGLTFKLAPINLLFLLGLAVWLRSTRSHVVVGVAAFVGAVLAPFPAAQPQVGPSMATLSGVVTSVPRLHRAGQSFDFDTETGRLRVHASRDTLVGYGSRLNIFGKLRPVRKELRDQYAIRGVH